MFFGPFSCKQQLVQIRSQMSGPTANNQRYVQLLCWTVCASDAFLDALHVVINNIDIKILSMSMQLTEPCRKKLSELCGPGAGCTFCFRDAACFHALMKFELSSLRIRAEIGT